MNTLWISFAAANFIYNKWLDLWITLKRVSFLPLVPRTKTKIWKVPNSLFLPIFPCFLNHLSIIKSFYHTTIAIVYLHCQPSRKRKIYTMTSKRKWMFCERKQLNCHRYKRRYTGVWLCISLFYDEKWKISCSAILKLIVVMSCSKGWM